MHIKTYTPPRIPGKSLREKSASSSSEDDTQPCMPPKKRKALTPRKQNLQALYVRIDISEEARTSIHAKKFKRQYCEPLKTAYYDETSGRVTGDPEFWRQALEAFVDFDPAATGRLFSLFGAELQQSLMDSDTGLHVVKTLRDADILQAPVQEPVAWAKAIHPVVAAYDALATKWDLNTFPKYVKCCPDRPLLAKTLTDYLIATLTGEEESSWHGPATTKAPLTDALDRVELAVDSGLPLNEVIACLTAKGRRPEAVLALCLLLQHCCAITGFRGDEVVDLLSCMRCFDEESSTDRWMHELGQLLASESASEAERLQHWLGVMKSLVTKVTEFTEFTDAEVQSTKSKLMSLLRGFEEGAGHLNDARVMCRFLGARLTDRAGLLVERLKSFVDAARTFSKFFQPEDLEKRKLRIRDDEQVRNACALIVDELVSGELPLAEVIRALEFVAKGSETVSVLMHARMAHARLGGDPSKIFLLVRDMLGLAAQPEQLVLHMAPALLESEAERLIHHLVEDAAGILNRLVPILSLLDALCSRVQDSEVRSVLLSLNEKVKTLVQEQVAGLVQGALRTCDDLCEVGLLDRTVRFTPDQLKMLAEMPGEMPGNAHLEGAIRALVTVLSKGHTVGAFVVDPLRSLINEPSLTYVVSLLIRALLDNWIAMDSFIGVLTNADVPASKEKEHIGLARQVALGFRDWLPTDINGLDDRIGLWIDNVAFKPDGSAPGFDVLQVMLDELSSSEKWNDDVALRLIKRGTEVRRLSSVVKAEPLRKQYIVPALELIAKKRSKQFGADKCELRTHKDKILKDDDQIATAVSRLLLAVRHGVIHMPHVIEWLCLGKETAFDRELLLLEFIGPLFAKWAVSGPYELSNFMNLLLDTAAAPASEVGIVFGTGVKSWVKSRDNRKRMIDVIRDLSNQEEEDKLLRLEQFALAYHEVTNNDDDTSKRLSGLLREIHARKNVIVVPNATGSSRPEMISPYLHYLESEFDSTPMPASNLISGADRVSQEMLDRGPTVELKGANIKALNALRKEAGNLLEVVVGPKSLDSEPSQPVLPPRQGGAQSMAIPVTAAFPNKSLPVGVGGPVRKPSATLDAGVKIGPAKDADQFPPEGLATQLIGALNFRDIDQVKLMIKTYGLVHLDLTGTESRLNNMGIHALGTLLMDSSAGLIGLALGKIGRGSTVWLDQIKESGLEVLDISRFDGYNAYDDKYFTCSKFLETLTELFESGSFLSLKKLIVSHAQIAQSKEVSRHLDLLRAAAAARLAVVYI